MPEQRTAYEQNIVSNVETHGWFCASVFDPDGTDPAFSYSVGFARTLGCAEFIVAGLSGELMHAMLWKVFCQIKAGAVPADRKRWTGVLDGFECESRAVHPTNIDLNYLNSARWFWTEKEGRAPPLEAFQLVWPGARDGLFPWEEGCSAEVIAAQPPLWEPNQPDC